MAKAKKAPSKSKKAQKAQKAQKAHKRARPGTGGGGKFYHIELRRNQKYTTYRNQDVGKRGGLERLAGKTPDGRWFTVAWLIQKNKAEVLDNGQLKIKDPKDRSILKQIKGPIFHVKGDIFHAHPRTRS